MINIWKICFIILFLITSLYCFAEERVLKEVTLSMRGLGCCAGSPKAALETLDGISKKWLEFGKVKVIYDPVKVKPSQMIEALLHESYIASIVREPTDFLEKQLVKND